MPTEFVRIRDTKNKTDLSVARRRAEQLVERGDVEILDGEPAVNAFGEPLPPSAAQSSTGTKSKESTR